MSESHMLARVEPPQTFLAPSNVAAAGWTCVDCGQPIEAMQETIEVRPGEYWHADCWTEPDRED